MLEQDQRRAQLLQEQPDLTFSAASLNRHPETRDLPWDSSASLNRLHAKGLVTRYESTATDHGRPEYRYQWAKGATLRTGQSESDG